MRKLVYVLLLLPLLLLTGCSDGMTIYSQYREASDLELVRVIGADADPNGVLISISTGTDGEGSKPIVMSRTAATLPQALAELANNPSTREPYYAHAKQVLIGEEAAKDSITPYLDFIERSAEMRGSAYLTIVRGKAVDLLTDATDNEISAESMLSYLIENAAKTGQSCVFDASEVAAALAGRGCAMVMAVTAEPSDTEKGADFEKRVAPAGFAIIDDGRLVAYAEDDTARGAVVLSGRFKSAQIETQDSDGRSVSVQLTAADVKWKPVFNKDGALTGIDIEIGLVGNISSAQTGCDLYSDAWRKGVQANISSAYEHYAMSSVALSQRLGVDYLDVYGRIDSAEPYKMERISMDQFNKQFPELEINVAVNTVLRRTFDLESPLPADGGFMEIIGGGR